VAYIETLTSLSGLIPAKSALKNHENLNVIAFDLIEDVIIYSL
jgi:hypothetical protein